MKRYSMHPTEQAIISRLISLIGELTDPVECQVMPNGRCRSHDFVPSGDRRVCPHTVARTVLVEAGER